MTPEELKEYLGIVVDMEKNIFMQAQTMSQWEKEIAGLGIPRQFQEPSQPQEKPLPKQAEVGVESAPLPPVPPEQPKIMKRQRAVFGSVCFAITIFYWAGAIPVAGSMLPVVLAAAPISGVLAGAVTIGVMRVTSNDYRGIKKRYQDQKEKYETDVEAYPILLEQHRQRQQRCKRERQQEWEKACKQIEASNQAARAKYQEMLDAYQNDVRKDRQRVELENIKKEVLQTELSQMRELNVASKETLKQIYSKDIIFPKYRSMVMVCSLYEYVCSGRCDTLEGHEGAYNLLEMEIRLDKIVTQLDRAIQLLDTIRQNQYMVYSAIQDANRQSARILESTEQITSQLQTFQTSNQQLLGGIQAGLQRGIQAAEQQSVSMVQMTAQLSALQATSALTAYQTERTQRELHYMNRMDYLSGRNDDVFFNLPPVQ